MKPDEIVISDDGSADRTLSIVQKFSSSADCAGITIKLLTDNQCHGWRGIFEHALQNTSGDLVFLCDQDDVWLPEKVKAITDSFLAEPSDGVIFHNADMVDEQRKSLIKALVSNKQYGTETLNKLSKSVFLERAISGPLINGMCICVSRELLNQCFPFPKSFGFHDHWITFISVANDNCYYLNSILSLYRLHGNKTCGNHIYKGKVWTRFRKLSRRLFSLSSVKLLDNYYIGSAMKAYLLKMHEQDPVALETVDGVLEIGYTLYQVEQQPRLPGARTLCRLYRNNIRYRKSGSTQFIISLLHVLLTSQKKRMNNLQK